MKGILGRKAGMTSVFTDHGRNIPVSVIEVTPNVVTAVLSEEKNGYKAIQLAAFDRRDKTSTKPELGHLKKANTGAKRFVREIRDMDGYEVGAKLDASIFASGQLVDVTGVSKGKGFQGNIKRHNQKIGPKSHGGGGGSQPTRQVGSIGDVSSNRVFKGMTMPGHMGAEQVTVQNLEVVAVDVENNYLLVKGSIPGPNKGFVVVREAVKGLPSHEAVKLVDVKEAEQKNHLLEDAKKVGASVNTDMSLEEMKAAIQAAKEAQEAEKKAQEESAKAEEAKEQAEKLEEIAEAKQEKAEQLEAAGDKEEAEKLKAQAEVITKQVEATEEKAKEAEAASKEAAAEAAAKEAEAKALQVEEEAPVKEEGGE